MAFVFLGLFFGGAAFLLQSLGVSDDFCKSVFLIGFLIALFGFVKELLVTSTAEGPEGDIPFWNYLLAAGALCSVIGLLLNFVFQEHKFPQFLFYLGFMIFNVSIWAPMIINLNRD